MRAIGNGIGIPFRRNTGQGVIWPSDLKSALVCWYSPRKQKLTEYDVIEAYAEDFTYWTLDNTGITSTPKKIVIPTGTELKYVIAFRGFNSFTAGFDIKYTGNAVITYRYNKEDGTVGTIAIDKSGIYHLPASVRTQKNFGFYCNPQTVTEEATIEQLPTSILKDLSGNVGDGDDSDILIIGANNNRADAPREPYKGCHSDFLLFNRTLTQEEIDWVKNKIFQDTNN